MYGSTTSIAARHPVPGRAWAPHGTLATRQEAPR
jgi:hypothetical protein